MSSLTIRIFRYEGGTIRLGRRELAKFEEAVDQDDEVELESLLFKYNTPNINIRTQGHCLLGYTILMKARRCFDLLLQQKDIALNMQGIVGCPLEVAIDSNRKWALQALLAHSGIKLPRCVAASDPNRLHPEVRDLLVARFSELPELWQRAKQAPEFRHRDHMTFEEVAPFDLLQEINTNPNSEDEYPEDDYSEDEESSPPTSCTP